MYVHFTIVRVKEPMRTRWRGHVARMGEMQKLMKNSSRKTLKERDSLGDGH